AVALELLHDETFAAEEARHDAFLQRDADRHALGRREKSIFLADEPAAVLAQVERETRAGIRRREGDTRLAAAFVREHRHEQALARQQALAGTDELAHETRVLTRAVAEHARHRNGRMLVHHAAGLGHGALAGVELDLDVLHIVAVN